jgi:cell division protein FtsW
MILLTIVWTAMFFLAGGSYLFLSAMSLTGLGLLVFLYQSFPHFRFRIDRFLEPSLGGTYQTDKALEAFRNGGLFGTGPGDGKIKHVLPDGHTDYVFAVAAEEFGLVVGLLIICIFAAIILRSLISLRDSRDHWIQLAGTGLIILFGMQTIINMAVNLNLMPPKGMTLPFISYGGSSLLALALTMGMILSLTRHSSGQKRILSDGSADEIPLHKTFNLKGGAL